MNLRHAIKQAASKSELDVALGPIQQLLGVESGDVAGQVFGSVADGDAQNVEYWPHASPEERMAALQDYVKTEMMYMSESAPAPRVQQYEEFDPYTDPDTKAMLERAGIATHNYRR